MMPEVNNFKRKRPNHSSYIVNPDGNCTPSDSESDDESHNGPIQRKILRRESSDNEPEQIQHIDGDESNNSHASSDRLSQGNNQLLYAALRKIQELEEELAELDDADYDSGHHDEDDIDEGNGSDLEESSVQLHDHREEILDGEAEALGFAFCLKETFEYLAAQGITQDNPIFTSLRERFLGQCNQ